MKPGQSLLYSTSILYDKIEGMYKAAILYATLYLLFHHLYIHICGSLLYYNHIYDKNQ